MFKEILTLWKEEQFLKKIMQDFKKMLVKGSEIFTLACDVWWGREEAEKVHPHLYSTDRKINKEEQNIRRRLVEHLAINPRQDFNVCLVFMSVIKDAERIGDYAKNIFELESLKKFEDDAKFKKIFLGLQKEIEESLKEIVSAFFDANSEKATLIMKRHGKIGHECEELIRKIIEKNLSSDKAVCYTLLLRYFKRVSAHTANIASSIVNPLEKIDFSIGGIL